MDHSMSEAQRAAAPPFESNRRSAEVRTGDTHDYKSQKEGVHLFVDALDAYNDEEAWITRPKERQMQEAALAAFPNNHIREGNVEHFYFRESSESDQSPESTSPIYDHHSYPVNHHPEVRQQSSDNYLNWWDKHMQDHAKQVNQGQEHKDLMMIDDKHDDTPRGRLGLANVCNKGTISRDNTNGEQERTSNLLAYYGKKILKPSQFPKPSEGDEDNPKDYLHPP
ncbi:hypothetical protein FSARC_226 [Fusarium sarcochroum]|uniref:Uncharacterized protein n=1 Tax=Fusarium sarcochroum TaxID=1208366 RepID=A0A8H4UBS5_9HYPO|nr:hypothetical protein FSARC_226 [Fusarium sarcochroum]